MPLSSMQAAIASLLTTTIGLVVGLGVLNAGDGQQIVAIGGIVLGAAFQVANAVIHHGVTVVSGKDASKR